QPNRDNLLCSGHDGRVERRVPVSSARNARARVAAGIAVVAAALSVAGCSILSPSAEDQARAGVAYQVQQTRTLLTATLAHYTDPAAAAADIRQGQTLGIKSLIGLSADELEHLGTGFGLAGVYDVRSDSTQVTVGVLLVGAGESGGGWTAEQAYRYLCIEASGAPNSSAEDIRIVQLDCPAGLKDTVLRGSQLVEVQLDSLSID
ncbi:MAG: hypothetical protein Q8K56_00790, partial [Rhodoglobus sp.]|nr:hypothetical protein [Rhodoglobus sp.]